MYIQYRSAPAVGLRVVDLGLRVEGLGFRVKGGGFKGSRVKG
jgi:hypothetical protein